MVSSQWIALQKRGSGKAFLTPGMCIPCANSCRTHSAVWSVNIRMKPRYLRPKEAASLLGDASKIRDRSMWRPELSFDGLVVVMTEQDVKLPEQEKRCLPGD